MLAQSAYELLRTEIISDFLYEMVKGLTIGILLLAGIIFITLFLFLGTVYLFELIEWVDARIRERKSRNREDDRK